MQKYIKMNWLRDIDIIQCTAHLPYIVPHCVHEISLSFSFTLQFNNVHLVNIIYLRKFCILYVEITLNQ